MHYGRSEKSLSTIVDIPSSLIVNSLDLCGTVEMTFAIYLKDLALGRNKTGIEVQVQWEDTFEMLTEKLVNIDICYNDHKNNIKFIIGGRMYCPQATLRDANVCKNLTIHFVTVVMLPVSTNLTLRTFAIGTRMNGIFCKQYPIWILNTILIHHIHEWDVNLSHIIYDFIPPNKEINLCKLSDICMLASGREMRKSSPNFDKQAPNNVCMYCHQSTYVIPTLKQSIMEQTMKKYNYNKQNKNTINVNKTSYYFGVNIQFEFQNCYCAPTMKALKDLSDDAFEKGFIYNPSKINNRNVGQYFEIVEQSTNIPLKFVILDKGIRRNNKDETIIAGVDDNVDNVDIDGTMFILLKVDTNQLNNNTFQSLFVKNNGKVEVKIMVHENKLPAIYKNITQEKIDDGSIMGTIELTHSIYRQF